MMTHLGGYNCTIYHMQLIAWEYVQTIQSTIGKKMAAVHFTTMPCKPNTAYKAQRKPIFLQYLLLY